MEPTIRPGRIEDAAAIGEFTADTFEWGDYVSDALPAWLEGEDSCVMVAADENDKAIALGRGQLITPSELWLQGARVSEQWRRRGVASAIGRAIIDWAIGRGAKIARLLTEGWNEPAQLQVEKAGFQRTSDWVVGVRSVTDSKPATSGNGGQRAKAKRKLEIAHSSEAVPAWISWLSGPLVRPARGLHVNGWRWSLLTDEHLIDAGRRGQLWSSRAGWVITRRDDGTLYIDWLECGEDDIDDMLRSIVDLAVETHAELLRVTVPQVDWLVDALVRAGCDTHPMFIYERVL